MAGDAAFLPCGPLHRTVFTGGQLIPSEQRGREKERERQRERGREERKLGKGKDKIRWGREKEIDPRQKHSIFKVQSQK